MTDTTWEQFGAEICRLGRERGDIGRRTIRDLFGVSKSEATRLAAKARESEYRFTRAAQPARLEAEAVPSGDEPINELLDRRCRDFTRRDAASRDEITIRVKADGPIGILVFGDPHLDDDGTDLPLLRRHVELIQQTDGLFGGCLGDVQNNWVARLSRLYGEQGTTVEEAWRLVEWYFKAVDWAFVVRGNHDNWHENQALSYILRDAPVYASGSHEVKLSLTHPDWERPVRLWARHDFRGKSAWSATHGLARAAVMRDYKADVYLAGHIHDAESRSAPREDGTWYHAVRLGAYKVHDEYAEENDFPARRGGEAVLLVIDGSRDGIGRVTPFFDIERGVEYLRFLRGR